MLTIFAQLSGQAIWTQFIQDIISGVFVVAGAALASGVITTLITQALKWEAIKIPAQKYPVPVAVVLSIITSGAAVWMTGLVDLVGWISWLVMAVATLLVSTQTYKVVKDMVDQIKQPETSASTAPGNPEPNPLPPPSDNDGDGFKG